MAPRFDGTDDLYDYLLGFVNVEKGQKTAFKLDRMNALCDRLGSPQAACRTVHVAGSKGKGSVSVMAARLLEAAGARVGLYTSPHFLRWKERISLAGDEMEEELLLGAAEEVLALVDGAMPSDFPGDELPTYFELTTLISFCAFRRAGCDIAVIETGLGGRLDSTNVVDSEISVITPIELEHTEWLGDTIPLIAAEKAGIIKTGRPCYSSRQRPEAREVLARSCEARGSPFREAPLLSEVRAVDISAAGTRAALSFAPPLASRFPGGIELLTPMVGAIQAENMALALMAAADVEGRVDAGAAARGMAKAFLPARFQVLSRDPPIVLDGAHTPDSVRTTLDSFETLFPGPKALLFACAEDKKHAAMAAILAPHFDRITITRPGTFKKGDLSALAESFAAAGARFNALGEHLEAMTQATGEAARLGLPLLVTGSFYLCSEFARLFAWPRHR
jgi:dihydrofolate synthase / folylpolyglutamate synthase